MKLSKLTRAAILAALTAIATLVIPVPIPGGGYANAGDIVVLMCGFILGPGLGALAAGIGSAIADLSLGYTMYAPGTLVIKAATAAVAGLIYLGLSKKLHAAAAMPAAGVAGECVMVLGYFGYETLIISSAAAAAVGMLPNIFQGVVGVVGATALMLALKKPLARLNHSEIK